MGTNECKMDNLLHPFSSADVLTRPHCRMWKTLSL
jgi:hypothetical protein